MRQGLFWHRVMVILGAGLLLTLGATWSWRISGRRYLQWAMRQRATGRPVAAAVLHGRLLPFVHRFSRPGYRPWAVLVSTSRDGALIADIMATLGYRLLRGSSGRGGERAMREMLRMVRDERDAGIAITVDGGGRGPRGRVKAGVTALAAGSSGWVLPAAASARRCWIAQRAWDRFCLPLPGAELHLHFGRPIAVPRRADAARHELARQRLEDELVRMHEALDRQIGLRRAAPVRV